MIYPNLPDDFYPRFDIASCYVMHDSKFLLLHRLPEKSQGGKWGVPAGKRETHEDARTAMARELEEETGIRVNIDTFTAHGFVNVRHPEHDFVYHMFSLVLDKRPSVSLKQNEHQDFRWVTPQEAFSMPLVDDLDWCIQYYYPAP